MNEPVSITSVLQIATGLILVVSMILGAAWFLRRFGRFQGGNSAELRLVGGLHLGQRERIVLVQAGSDRLVVGLSPGCIRTLHVMAPAPAGDEGDAAAEAQHGFLERLHHEIRRRAGQ